MEITNEFRNELLKRKELNVIIKSEGNFGFEKAMRSVVEKLKVAEENVVVKNVRSNFGSDDFLIEALVYDSAEDKKKIEPKVKEKKKAVGS